VAQLDCDLTTGYNLTAAALHDREALGELDPMALLHLHGRGELVPHHCNLLRMQSRRAGLTWPRGGLLSTSPLYLIAIAITEGRAHLHGLAELRGLLGRELREKLRAVVAQSVPHHRTLSPYLITIAIAKGSARLHVVVALLRKED
jgi:hypothetical protein